MKKIIVLFISVTMLNSCKPQNNIDLLNLPLPLNKDILINENYKVKVEEQFPGVDYYKASSSDPNLMYASGEAISNDKNTPLKLKIFLNSKTDKVIGYNLKIKKTKDTKELEKLLKDKYNTPNYYRSLSYQTTSIWSDTNNNTIVFFAHYYPTDKNIDEGANLFIFNLKPLEIVEQLCPNTMRNYTHYLTYRKDLSQSYREYAEEQAKDYFDDIYIKAISNPYKH